MLALILIVSVIYVSFVDSVPSVCDAPLNSSDCGLQPTVVYTYSSKTCHLATWKGCPTTNKFDDERQCLMACTKRIDVTEPIPKSETVKTNRCKVLLNTNRCTKQMKQVYTYSDVKGACVTALWFGCPSENMFEDVSSCQRSCHEKNKPTMLTIIDKFGTTGAHKPKKVKKFDKYKDINEKAYFLYKLNEVNKQAVAREKEDIDFMMQFHLKYNVL